MELHKILVKRILLFYGKHTKQNISKRPYLLENSTISMPGTNMKYTKYKQIRSGVFFKAYSTLSVDNLRLMIQYL